MLPEDGPGSANLLGARPDGGKYVDLLSFIVDKVDGHGAQQDQRMLELASFANGSGYPDDTKGRLKKAVQGGHCKLQKPSINAKGVLFVVDHKMTLDPSDPARCICINTVLLDGSAYVTQALRDGNIVTPRSVTEVAFNVSKLSQKIVEKNITSAQVAALKAPPTARQMRSATLSGDGLYNNPGGDGGDGLYNNTGGGGGDGLYNNTGGDGGDGLYNNVNPALTNFKPATATQSLYQNVGSRTLRIGMGTHRGRS